MNKYMIEVYTNWCGEDNYFTAIASSDTDPELHNAAASLSYNNFSEFSGINGVLEELFPEVEDEEYTDEMVAQAADQEGEYYGYTIREITDDEEEYWDDYELAYDAREKIV